ncbi:hypothetical protein WN51_12664 [Melipona quadrifasciata]|uniref:Uncharacterized protein n=1 Tax=Melipona quadrifasciata TaxID=166423 RepID=A0A0M9A0Q7_9HYME|nr:hypothetical protein WN51_12664 [Melipona quadrifasciata]
MFPGYEFILRKCIASAQLNRKHQSKDILNTTLNKSIQDLLHKPPYISIVKQEKNSTFQQVQTPNLKLNNSHPFNNSKINHNDVDIGNYFTKHIENTPLKTLDIKATQSLLPTFTKKNLLPEFERITSKTTNSSSNIIVIKSAM